MKLLRWLRSRPLARVRRNLATRKRVTGTAPMSSEIKAFYTRELLDPDRLDWQIEAWRRADLADERREYDRLYRQQDEIAAAIRRGTFRPTRNRREMFASKEDWKLL